MRIVNFLIGYLLGALIGAVAVLLTTPQSGSDLKGSVRSRVDEIWSEARQAATSQRSRMESQLTSLRGD